MLKVSLPNGQVVIDPFTGQSLGRGELSERLEPYKLRNGLVEDFDVPVGLYLQAAQPREILTRMLRNLKELHRTQEDWLRLIAVQDRLIVLLPDAWVEYRDRGLAWAELGDNRLAVSDLDLYVAHTDDPLERDAIEQRLRALWRELN
jgi:regulator of sirC expression with transglutaminase-like and TPR domain